MEGSFRRGWGADFYDEPGWQVALAGLEGRYRLDILRAGLVLIERTAAQGDQARVRELAVGIAAALDAELQVQPGEVHWYFVDLRAHGPARGFQRQGFHSLAELLVKLESLVALEAQAMAERRLLEAARGKG